jgi:hypothetical protein
MGQVSVKLREQPVGGLLDKLVFAVTLGAHVAFGHPGEYPAPGLPSVVSSDSPLKSKHS